MKTLILVLMVFFSLTSCSYSMNMIEAKGKVDDVVDETRSSTTSVVPTISIPASTL